MDGPAQAAQKETHTMSHDPFAQMNDELNAAQAKGRKAPKSDKSLKKGEKQ